MIYLKFILEFNLHFWNNFLILLRKIKHHIYYYPKWRALNGHNKTTIKCYFDFSKVKIGNYTYGELDIQELYGNSYVRIGNYCSFGQDIKLYCGNHNYKHFSTYPFASIIGKEANKKIKYKFSERWGDLEHVDGSIIIDDDVWIGAGTKILGGVHIGQGAVIGAGAVVTKDIPPYAIAGGVPAKVIKYRFSEDKIKKLLKIDYSNIPIEKFWEIYPETIKEDFDIDYILEKLKN